MRRHAAVAALLAVFAMAPAAADDASAAAPQDATNLAAANIDYSELAARHARASEAAVPHAPYTFERSRIEEGDLAGAMTIARAGDDYREDVTLGPIHRAFGRIGGKRWSENPNGSVRTVEGVHDESEAQASDSHALLGLSTALDAYVVKTGSSENANFVFYDRATYRVVRSERLEGDAFEVTTYDDFGPVDGRIAARHVKSDNGKPYGTYERWLESSTHAASVDAAAIAEPAAKVPLAVAGGRIRLPAQIVSDRIVVESRMGGRKVDFILDSGASTLLLDTGIADELKFAQYGHSTQTVAGSFVSRQALVPNLAVGSLSLDNVFVETGPADFSIGPDTPVAGLLGSDFLSESVFAIDYAAGTVDALDAATFALPKDAVVLPARFDDGLPTIDVAIGGARSHTFVVDTGADRSMLFTHFLDAHPHETVDRGLGAAERAASPFRRRIAGVGGNVTVRTLEASDFRIGTIAFPTWPFYAVASRRRDFESNDYDGLVGQDVLRYFTVYLDYPHERIALVPNARYAARFL